jgi:hypothetical protein
MHGAMRSLIALASLLVLASLAPSATAAQCPPVCVSVGVTPTTPTPGCGDCVGLDAHAGTLPPTGCYDCDTVGAAVGVQHDGSGTTASARVCKGGFVYFCVVDEEIPLPQ